MSFLTTIYHRIIRETLIPLVMMLSTPHLTILLPYIVINKKGSLVNTFALQSPLQVLQAAWNAVDWFDSECWLIVIGTFVWGLVMLIILPGKAYYGPPTRANFRPQYWHNGFLFYVLSMAIAIPVIWNCSVLHLYYKFPTITGILIVLGLIFCVILYIKGFTFPDLGEYDRTNNPIFNFYWGTELYPQMGQYVSLKVFINCRFGMFIWQLIVLVAWKSNYELNQGHLQWPITVSSILQTGYLIRTFYWEDGYMQSFDATFDRFGYYIAWGCIAYVPAVYTLQSLYLVENSPCTDFNVFYGIIILLLGFGSTVFSYWIDYQRQVIRQLDGNCTIWSKKPVLIRAKYRDVNGNERNSVLLASGFWGVGRHLNYLCESLVFLSFALPALWYSPLPYFTFVVLTVLLVHRSSRDDYKCAEKYGKYWDEYCRIVPYKLVPGLF